MEIRRDVVNIQQLVEEVGKFNRVIEMTADFITKSHDQENLDYFKSRSEKPRDDENELQAGARTFLQWTVLRVFITSSRLQ
jgi:hypothetical protein